jgi:hypothetical protein
LLITVLLGLVVYYGVSGGLTAEVDETRFKETIAGMQSMVTMVEEGNIEQADKTFNEVHGFFHDVDLILREKDRALAEQLWDAVTLI